MVRTCGGWEGHPPAGSVQGGGPRAVSVAPWLLCHRVQDSWGAFGTGQVDCISGCRVRRICSWSWPARPGQVFNSRLRAAVSDKGWGEAVCEGPPPFLGLWRPHGCGEAQALAAPSSHLCLAHVPATPLLVLLPVDLGEVDPWSSNSCRPLVGLWVPPTRVGAPQAALEVQHQVGQGWGPGDPHTMTSVREGRAAGGDSPAADTALARAGATRAPSSRKPPWSAGSLGSLVNYCLLRVFPSSVISLLLR